MNAVAVLGALVPVDLTEAKGRTLNYLMAQAEGLTIYLGDWHKADEDREHQLKIGDWPSGKALHWVGSGKVYQPTQDWEYAGPLFLSTHRMSLESASADNTLFRARFTFSTRQAHMAYRGYFTQLGSTPLEALCRSFVRQRLGTRLAVPEEFL